MFGLFWDSAIAPFSNFAGIHKLKYPVEAKQLCSAVICALEGVCSASVDSEGWTFAFKVISYMDCAFP